MFSTSLREVGTNPFVSNETGQSVGKGDADAQPVASDLNFLCPLEAEQPLQVVAYTDQCPFSRHLYHST